MKKRMMVLLSCFILLNQFVLISVSHAGMVTTKMTLQENVQLDRAAISGLIERDEAKAIFKAYGVDKYQLTSRIDKLTVDEIALINDKVEDLPAGSGFFGTVGLIVVILVILELLGAINIFHAI